MKKAIGMLFALSLLIAACQPSTSIAQNGKKTIVVTYSILGALVKDLVGNHAAVTVLIPNGQDPHEWEPSARGIEALMKADLVIQNGLDLEGGLQKTLAQAASAGVKIYIASDHITVRRVGVDEGISNEGANQVVGIADPHIWIDPLAMKSIVASLAGQIKADLGMDVSVQAADLEARLDNLNSEITNIVATLPEANRFLVTGHESLGYFADRYGFKLIGAIIPSLNSQAEVSAAKLAALKILIQENQVKAIFAEVGTPKAISDSLGNETGAKVVQLSTHILPTDGSYFTYMRQLANTIVENLR
jgi:zinc/manganese transport system substrate-binding protein